MYLKEDYHFELLLCCNFAILTLTQDSEGGNLPQTMNDNVGEK